MRDDTEVDGEMFYDLRCGNCDAPMGWITGSGLVHFLCDDCMELLTT
jgi:hypothetical protein